MSVGKMAQRCSHSQLVSCSKCHVKPYPEIIMSGYLTKSPPLNKSILVKRWKVRYFILRADATLEYHESNRAADRLGVIDLQQTQRMESGLETKKYANIFDLIMPGRTYFFSAGDLDIMFEWVSQIKIILNISDDVVYPQKTVSKILNQGDKLLQYYVRTSSRKLNAMSEIVSPCSSAMTDYDRMFSVESNEDYSATEDDQLNQAHEQFRGSLVRSIHYTVTSTSRKPKERTAVDSLSDDSVGPQWNERRNESFGKLKEIILSTGKGIIPTPPATVFYEESTQSFPLYTPVQRHGDKPKLHFQRSKSLDESYDQIPPPIPPKFRSKSPRGEFSSSLGIILDKRQSVPSRERQLSVDNETESKRQRMASLGKICKIRVNGFKERTEQFSRPSALDPESQLSVTDDRDVVCFGAIVKKVFGYHGGRITFRESNLEVEIPKGAICEDQIQGFYFKVSSDSGLVEETSGDLSATHVCSPLLQFGPVGAKFDQPIRIKMPHCLDMNVDDFHVQLIFAYEDSNGMDFLRIDAFKNDFDGMEMFSFNTFLGPVVFNLQPDFVVLEISHFVFQWVQLVAVYKPRGIGRDICVVSKRERLACFLSEPSEMKAILSLYLYNDYNDVFNKIVELEQLNHSQYLCKTDAFLLTNENKLSNAHIVVGDFEFGYQLDGRNKREISVPAFGDTYHKCEFKLTKLFHNEKPFTCELNLFVENKRVTSLDIEAVDTDPKRVTQMKRDLSVPTRQQELAETLGISVSMSNTFPLSLLSEAQRKYGCELEQVSDALKQLDAAELLLSSNTLKQ